MSGRDGDPEAPGSGVGLGRATLVVVRALDLAGEERRAYVERTCGGDEELRAEVDSLLAEHEQTETDFLEIPAIARYDGGEGDPVTGEVAAPEWIGPYRILGRLGEGGMATVYLAEQDVPVQRRVALKVIRSLHQPRARARFAVEAQALAKLNHPNVAALYELGTVGAEAGADPGLDPGPGLDPAVRGAEIDTSGWPYVAMEWVEGQDLVYWCDEHDADLDTRIELFLGVCAGIQHAHEKGVLHCDLKPTNVLVTEVDGRPVAKVIDFGIARALDEPLVGFDTNLTGEMFVGSPLYVSPEAARRGGRKTLDVRSDVYSLGLILYELLAGVLPFDLTEHSLWSLLKKLQEEPIPAPSARLQAVGDEPAAAAAARRGVQARQLQRVLRGDLDAIVLRASARNPAERYSSPAALAADLRRHLDHRPVRARKGSPAYLVRRFVRRNLGAVAAGVLLLFALSAGLVARTLEARRANAEAHRARAALTESEQVRELILGLFEGADPETAAGEVVTVRDLLDQGADRLRRELADRPEVRARLLHTIGALYTKLGAYGPAEGLVSEAAELRQSVLPAGHPDLLESRTELGLLLRRQGRLDEAEPLLREVLEVRLADPGTDPALVASSYNHVGNVYWSQQRYGEAEAAHRAALAIRRRLADPSAEAASANNLGVLLLARRRYAEAWPLLERAIQIFRTELGPGHPRLAAALNNIGLVERNLRSWQRAEKRFEEAAEVWEAAYGTEHPRPLLARRNLADELKRKKRRGEALETARSFAATAERLDHAPSDLVGALRHRGRIETWAGETEAGLATFRRAVERSTELLGAEHPETLYARDALANALIASGEAARGRQILDEVARIQDAVLPADHPSRSRTEQSLARADHAAGDHAAAEARYRRELARQQERSGAEHLSNSRLMRRVADELVHLGRDAEAVELYERALSIRRREYGDDHPDVARAAFDLGQAEARLGRTAQARERFELAVAVRRAVFPAGDEDLLAAIAALEALGAG